MTVSSTTNQVIYTGSGGSEFEFTFGLFATSDLVVKTEVIATGVQATLTETTDYTVDETELGIGYGNGGKVTLTAESFPDGLSSAYKIIIKRVLPLTQEIDLVENDPTRAEVVEEAFDRSVMTDQQLQEQIDRCIKVSETASKPTAEEILVSISASATAAEAAETGAEAAQKAAEAAEKGAEAAQKAAEAAETGAEAAQKAAEAAAASIPDDIIVGDGTVNPTNLISNGDFESWSAGAAAAPDGYTAGGAGVAVAKETTIIKMGTASASVTRSGADCYIFQDVQDTRGITYWKGRTVTFGCWVYATVADRARLQLIGPTTTVYSSYHTGDSTWQWLTVSGEIGPAATTIRLVFGIWTGDTTAYFDGAMCVEGASTFAFSPKPAEEGVWADYSAVSTVVGWSSFTFKKIYTKKIGKTVFVNFYITGTSDNATTTFTVPYARAIGIPYINFLHNAKDNGGTIVAATGYMSNLSAIVILTKNCNQSAFTASGDKYVSGQFFYEAA